MGVHFQQRVLDNGLTVIAERDDEAHSAAAGYFVKTGARDETPELMGVSHFLEHMMFKGTDDLSAEQVNQAFDDLGARNNAYTSHEMTCFYAHVLPEKLLDSVDLLGRMMRPALRTEDFDTEKGVILEEIAMYKDNPFWVLYESVSAAHFRDHPMGHRVLGTPETIQAMQPDAMAAYFRHRYSADNSVVALAGRLDFDACCDAIEARCKAWERTDAMRDASRPAVGADNLTLHDEKVTSGYLLLVADGPDAADDRRYAATLLAQILGASDNSRLHWALIEEGLAEEAMAAYEPHDGTGEFFVYASGDPTRLGEIQTVIEREIQGLAASVTEDDLERLRNKVATGVTVGSERPADRMQRLGRLWTTLGEYRPLEDELTRINSVTLDDLRSTFEAFPLRPRTLGTLTPSR
ncbi:MAG: pitrilysin family protein [Planctomycetota bacterium]